MYEEGRLLSQGYIALQAESAPTGFQRVEVLSLRGCMNPRASNFESYYVSSDASDCVYGGAR